MPTDPVPANKSSHLHSLGSWEAPMRERSMENTAFFTLAIIGRTSLSLGDKIDLPLRYPDETFITLFVDLCFECLRDNSFVFPSCRFRSFKYRSSTSWGISKTLSSSSTES